MVVIIEPLTLSQLLEAVRDEKLSLSMLERYRDDLVRLKTNIHMERAELKKERAFFMLKCEEKTMAAKNLAWDVTQTGQRLLTLTGYLGGITGEIDSLTSRIFAALRHGEV